MASCKHCVVCVAFYLHLALQLQCIFVSICLTGDGLWLCETSERSNMDALWHARVPGSGNYSEQSTYKRVKFMVFLANKLSLNPNQTLQCI